MAPGNRPSALAKLKTRVCVSPEAESFNLTRSTPALPPLANVQSTLKLETKAADSENYPDPLGGNAEEDEEKCETPKLQEHKIPPALCCPPAPMKRRSVPVKRKLPANRTERFYILSDSDIQSLFGPDLAKRKVISKSPKEKSTVKEGRVHINMSKKFEEIQAISSSGGEVQFVGRNR